MQNAIRLELFPSLNLTILNKRNKKEGKLLK